MRKFSFARRSFVGALAVSAALLAPVPDAAAQTRLRVNYIPIFDVTSLFVAIDRGFFAEEGLTIEPTPSGSGAAGIPGLMSGGYDIMFGNVISTFLAQQQGFDLRIIAPGVKLVPAEPEGSGLIARKADGIKTGRDLEGKTVAVNARNGVLWLYARAWVKKTGGNPDKVSFKEVAFPQMLDALRGKQLDAIFTVEPFFTNALNDTSLALVERPYRAVQPQLEAGQYLTTAAFLEKNPEIVARFGRAIIKGVEWFNQNKTSPDAHRIIAGFTRMDPAVVAKQTLRTMPTQVDLAELSKTMGLMKEHGLLKSDVDVKAMVAPSIVK